MSHLEFKQVWDEMVVCLQNEEPKFEILLKQWIDLLITEQQLVPDTVISLI